jgi:UDP-N-acetylmuramyl pentapeptide phosphotransferase/UDP-N-acetylglucosamine-1-phosphate transferase
MSYALIIIFSFTSFFFLNYFFRRYNILIDKKILPHKSFVSNKNVPVIGGFIIVFYLLIFNHSYKFIFFSLLLFLIGILSDLFILKKPSKKFILQFFIVLFFLVFYDLKILSTKVFFLDYFIENKIFSILFTLFCLLVLINGSNFIDGINTLLCGYYLLVLIAIIYICSNNFIIYNISELKELLLVLSIIYSFNFFSKLYLGDSGAFLISFVVGYYLIDIANNNPLISPMFIVLLLWYPGFENFFSIFRKLSTKLQPSKPDNFHLHQLLFNFLKKKINKSKDFINTLTGNIINLYNFLIFYLGIKFFNYTKYLIFLIFINIFLYLLIYFFLKTNVKKNI